ncbi:MAG: hypothetical protein CV087_00425 [Candidatus Brocadia sp. WS118]|nr:MAG: hypothetical protein CV087_00425 [Candidatus Brocadia sp. WS118]
MKFIKEYDNESGIKVSSVLLVLSKNDLRQGMGFLSYHERGCPGVFTHLFLFKLEVHHRVQLSGVFPKQRLHIKEMEQVSWIVNF